MTVQDRLKQVSQTASYLTKLYIKNDAGTFVDYSDRYNDFDRSYGIRRIIHSVEGQYEQPITKTIRVRMNNDDRFWDGDPDTQTDSAVTSWFGKDVKITVKAGSDETTIGYFRIKKDGIVTGKNLDYATVTLEPLTELLRRSDASTFKNGAAKYENRSWVHLVKEMIRSEFGTAAGAMPAGYTFPDDPRFTFADGNKHHSIYGKPPQWDGTDYNEDNTDIPYCVCYDETNELIYAGIGTHLWKFDIETDTWEDLGDGQGFVVGFNDPIRRVFVASGGVVCARWTTDTTNSDGRETLYINIWNSSTEAWDVWSDTSITDFFPGEFFLYTQAAAPSSWYIRGWFTAGSPPISPNDYGSNIPVPFSQFIGKGSPSNQHEPTGISSEVAYSAGDTANRTFDEGYIAVAARFSSMGGLQVNYGTKPNVAMKFIDAGAVIGQLFYVRWTGSVYQVSYANCIVGLATTTYDIIASGTTAFRKHGLQLNHDDGKVIYIEHEERLAASNSYDYTRVFNCTSTTGSTPVQLVQNTQLASNNDIITDVIYNIHLGGGAGEHLTFTKMKANNMGGFPTFQIVDLQDYTTSISEVIVDSSRSYYHCPTQQYPYSHLPLVMDTQSGAVKQLDVLNQNIEILLDGGLPPVYEAPFCADMVFTDDEDPDVYGLSWPYHHPESQEAVPEGKYYLWQYNAKHTGRVELADFEGMNKLDAIAQLCQAFDHVGGFAPDGDYYVTPRSPDTTPTVTITDSIYEHGHSDIRNKGSREVENFIEGFPYAAVLEPMQTTLRLKANSQYNGNVLANQLDTKERRVRLRCIGEGLITDGVVRFDYQTFFDKIETLLSVAYSGSGTSVTVESVVDINVGDTVSISGSAERTITAIAGNVLTIDSAWTGENYPILSKVLITHTKNGLYSSEGVTTLDGAITNVQTSIDVDDASNIGVGNYIRVQGNTDHEEMKVTAISGNTLTVVRSTYNNQAASDGADISCIVLVGDAGEWHNVGGQGITVRFDNDQRGDEKPMQIGDSIEFECRGLILRKQKVSVSRFADQDSIDDNEKSQARRRVDNRFMTSPLLNNYVYLRGNRYKDKKRTMNVHMPLDLQFAMLGVFYLVDADVFPDDTNNRIGAIVRRIQYDPEGGSTVYGIEEQ